MTSKSENWKRGQFFIATDRGPQKRKGFTCKGLGLYREFTEDDYDPEQWSLTHINSGLKCCELIGSKAAVLPAATAVAEGLDWSFAGTGKPDNANETMHALARQHPEIMLPVRRNQLHIEAAVRAVEDARS